MIGEINREEAVSLLSDYIGKNMLFGCFSTENGDGGKSSQMIEQYNFKIDNEKQEIVIFEMERYHAPNVHIPISNKLLAIYKMTTLNVLIINFTYYSNNKSVKIVTNP